jgi:glycosyltransferase involved in cell wall biosynthesis
MKSGGSGLIADPRKISLLSLDLVDKFNHGLGTFRRRKPHPLNAVADAARDRREWATAAAAYRQVLQAEPDRANIWVQYGNMLKEDKRLEDSEAAYLEALRLIPDDADTHLQYGHLLKISHRLDEAVEHYRQSALLDPSRPDARNEIAALAQQGLRSAQDFMEQQVKSPYSRSLNVKLAGTRMQLAEVMAEFRRLDARRKISPEGTNDLRILNDAFDSIGSLLRAINSGRLDRVGVDTTIGSITDATQKITVVFDLSDLIQYFRNHRLPTGIQRVQSEVIYIALIKPDPIIDIRVCCFTERHDYWREMPVADFINLYELSLTNNDCTAPDWRAAMIALEAKLDNSPNFVFPHRSWLVNIGTSWWLQNYFLRVREAKTRNQINYVPFVHDMIPIKTPEFCVAGLTQDFISWVLGVFLHADHFLVNSAATRKDLREVAVTLGHEIGDDDIRVVKLDADFRRGETVPFDPSFLRGHRLIRNGYVLFVATIESRKNHLTAFDAWLRLCKEYGKDKVPKLVCVGYRGWLNEAVYAKLNSSEELKEKVVILAGVPDRELAILYQGCLFTLFPSFYEGWGLPVTESLCYGKVPVTSNSSSLPEAGGEFAEYFTIGDDDKLFALVQRLIYDPEYRDRREQLIKQNYQPRHWDDITDDIISAVKEWNTTTEHNDLEQVLRVTVGRYYPLSRNSERRIHSSMTSGEVFRTGNAWWGCDDWGCWTKQGPASMAMRVTEGSGRYRLYLGLQGAPEKETPYDVMVTPGPMVRGVLKVGKPKWLKLDLDLTDSDTTLHVVVEGYETGSSRSRPEEPLRAVSLGVIGFLLCRYEDTTTRTEFIEAVALDHLDELARMVPEGDNAKGSGSAKPEHRQQQSFSPNSMTDYQS